MQLRKQTEFIVLSVARGIRWSQCLLTSTLGQQSRRGQAAFAQALGQRHDDGGQIEMSAVNVFAADDSRAQEAAGFVIELFVHFLADEDEDYASGESPRKAA